MAQFKSFDPRVEVNGRTVLSVMDGMGVMKGLGEKILKQNGFDVIGQDDWYPQQSWLNVFKAISDEVGPNTLYQIGLKIPENATFPAEIDNLEKALSAIDVAYHMNHRGGEIGSYAYRKTGDRSAVVECPNPYPCDFDRGIISAMSRRFSPEGHVVYVTHDDKAPCRKKGADSCTYRVSW